MTEEKYIETFLDKNYEVILLPHNFGVLDKKVKNKMDFSYFKIEMENIMMKTSFPIIDKWFTKNSKFLIEDLNKYIEDINYSKNKSLVILDEVIKNFNKKEENKYDIGFIKNVFFNYYKTNIILPKLKNHISEIQNSNEILKIINDMEDESESIKYFVLDYLNEWYSTSILGQKITNLFRQFVVTLGPRNWKVTWVGHGEVTKEKIKQEFKDESEYQINIVFQKYNQWYEEAIIEASERMLKIY